MSAPDPDPPSDTRSPPAENPGHPNPIGEGTDGTQGALSSKTPGDAGQSSPSSPRQPRSVFRHLIVLTAVLLPFLLAGAAVWVYLEWRASQAPVREMTILGHTE